MVNLLAGIWSHSSTMHDHTQVQCTQEWTYYCPISVVDEKNYQIRSYSYKLSTFYSFINHQSPLFKLLWTSKLSCEIDQKFQSSLLWSYRSMERYDHLTILYFIYCCKVKVTAFASSSTYEIITIIMSIYWCKLSVPLLSQYISKNKYFIYNWNHIQN